MDLNFDSLTLHNFGSFVEATFNFKSYPCGLNFIRGRNEYEPRLGANGAGKTMLWNALCWGLYGRTADGRRNPDVRSWYADGPTEVAIQLRVDNKKHEIVRTIQPNKLLLDDDVTGQEQIEKLIRLGFETFTHTILLGQGQDLFFDLSPSDKMKRFSEALGLERWSIRSKIASDRVTEIQQEIEHKAGELVGVDKLLDHIEASITVAEGKARAWMDERNDRLRGHREGLGAAEKQFVEQQDRLDKAILAADGAGTEYDALSKELEKLKDNLTNNRSIKAKLEAKREQQVLNIDAFRGFLVRIEQGECPTCGQTLRNAAQHKHTRELENKIIKGRKECEDIDKQLGEIVIEPLEKQLITLQTAHQKFKKTLDQSTGEINLYQRRCNELCIRIETLKHSISELELNKNPYSEQTKALIKQHTKTEGQHRDLKADIDKLNKRLERTRFWIKGFKDVQLYIIDEVLQELELVTNSMLPDVGLDDWKITYSVEKETQQGNIQRALNVLITSPGNERPVSFKCWSGGEGQRLRIIGALALSDVLLNHTGITSNIEILDEPTRSLSPEGVNDLCPFLADRAQQSNKTVFFIDHMSIPTSHFATITTVVKSTEQVSMIESN